MPVRIELLVEVEGEKLQVEEYVIVHIIQIRSLDSKMLKKKSEI